jgi:hypothetical protein
MTDSERFPKNNLEPRTMRIKSLVTGLVALLLVCWSILMMIFLRPYKFDHDFHDEIDSPVLALELAPDASALRSVLQTANPTDEQCARKVLKINNGLDLILIPIYTCFLWFFADLISPRSNGMNRYIRIACLLCIMGAALFDYLEDWGIARTLDSRQLTDSLAQATRFSSLVKWGLVGGALLLTSILLFRAATAVYSIATMRLLAILYGVAGFLVLSGLVRNPLIEFGMKIFAFLVVINAIGLLGPILMRRFPGIEPVYIRDFCQQRKLRLEGEPAVQPRHLSFAEDRAQPTERQTPPSQRATGAV